MGAQSQLDSLMSDLKTKMNRLKEARVVARSYFGRIGDPTTGPYIALYEVVPTYKSYRTWKVMNSIMTESGPRRVRAPVIRLWQPYAILNLEMKGQTYNEPIEPITSTFDYGMNPEDAEAEIFPLIGKDAIIKDIDNRTDLKDKEAAVKHANEVFEIYGILTLLAP